MLKLKNEIDGTFSLPGSDRSTKWIDWKHPTPAVVALTSAALLGFASEPAVAMSSSMCERVRQESTVQRRGATCLLVEVGPDQADPQAGNPPRRRVFFPHRKVQNHGDNLARVADNGKICSTDCLEDKRGVVSEALGARCGRVG